MSIALEFLSNCNGDDAFGRGVVCFYCGWCLGKIEFTEFNSEGYCCLTIVEQSSDFCLGRGRHHMLDNSAFCVDWAICWWQEVWRFFRIGWY